MGAPYYQFCPVAKAMELLDERWTMLLLRELLLGTEHFNELRRGLPRMSPTLLSHRLDQLQRAGLIERITQGADVRYVLTVAGAELRPVVEQLSAWGVRWIGELGDADLDPKLLLWDMHRNVDHGTVPDARTVIALNFTDASPAQRRWWLVIHDGEADVCDADPGYDVSVEVRCTLRALTRFWRGDIEWTTLLLAEDATATGPSDLRRALPSWFIRPGYAAVPRVGAPVGAGRV
ncbi:putative HTH-type transcriptional regulator Rv3095 [Microbacterium sp. Bi98]|uniref:winged helix-turn-helix transcriptional regulator n=1 Tax=unclassified Microbacterium TaxID=2609290 RepID=UPI000701B077|nr:MULTISPECIES: helix-turn-helix domain-containing protein [unclassified Microbacterium]KRD53600.1 HxlR family transcriptional regulator [Microbacterium sp. Root280D1]CAH0219728.1 putative HTH-type transcriptional regulator Rv3095 [Microbacterium sp. Bi98]